MQSTLCEGSCRCFLHHYNTILWKLKLTCAKIPIFFLKCSRTEISCDALNELSDGSHLVNDIDFLIMWEKSAYEKFTCFLDMCHHMTMHLCFQWLNFIQLYTKYFCIRYKICWLRSSKLYVKAKFLEGTYLCRIDKVQELVYFVPSLVSFGETTNIARGPACTLCSR